MTRPTEQDQPQLDEATRTAVTHSLLDYIPQPKATILTSLRSGIARINNQAFDVTDEELNAIERIARLSLIPGRLHDLYGEWTNQDMPELRKITHPTIEVDRLLAAHQTGGYCQKPPLTYRVILQL